MTRAALLMAMAALLVLLQPVPAASRVDTRSGKDRHNGPQRILVLNGSTVHSVGELQMHVSNWGMFGSWPNTTQPFSEAPSAQWPAGSGVEYLFAAGLWVGALKSGVPAVTTAAFTREFDPGPDVRDIMYAANEGSRGGDRLPSPGADDDDDGEIDEDWLNGYDDDGDGEVDEDFSAVSKQMMSCQYVDDTPRLLSQRPNHNPLGIHVRQESYQWEEDRFDDFVGINYWITNVSNTVLEDIYIGFFADCDVGKRTTDNYAEDDVTGFVSIPVRCTDLGPVSMDIAYTYDADGDDGEAEGYFGVMFLGHTVDPSGETAPRRVGVHTYANFSGQRSFAEGGDPTDDFEAYQLLSSGGRDRDQLVPRDYRMLVSAGPFLELEPERTLVFQVAFVAGRGLSGMVANGANAQLTYEGAWFDLDNNPTTGVAGRETPVMGPVTDVVVDSCRAALAIPIDWNRREPIWINNDCAQEQLAMFACGKTFADSLTFMTGVGGNESQLNWIVGTAPPPPGMRLVDYAHEGVEIFWDNFSETVPDVKTLEFDFEGYRVWRADGWTRPLGTTELTGPSHDLWKLLFEADVVNGFGADTGLDRWRYEPLVWKYSAAQIRDMVTSVKTQLVEHPAATPPCPQGLMGAECDTVEALARAELGIRGGRAYYRFLDRDVHRGRPYFYAVTALDHSISDDGRFGRGKVGGPSTNFKFVEPRTHSQPAYAYNTDDIYVVPNPATSASMQPWALGPNNSDPTGLKVEFRNLPASRGRVLVYTVSGDVVQELPFDGASGVGSLEWDLVSRNGQDVTSGVYLYVVQPDDGRFKRHVGKFVVVR